jgi:hypothetical protein
VPFYYVRRMVMRRIFVVLGILLLILGLLVLLIGFQGPFRESLRIPAGIFGGGSALLGFLTVYFATRPPTTEIMHLARENHGLLTLSEIVTTLNISPKRAIRSLRILQAHGIASQRWQEFRKNLWEFPDYMTLPLFESIELAKTQGGRLTAVDLTASGHSREIARQTMVTLREKGLAQPDPDAPANATAPDLIVTTQ